MKKNQKNQRAETVEYNARQALYSLRQLKAALDEAGTFGYYQGDYCYVESLLEKLGGDARG